MSSEAVIAPAPRQTSTEPHPPHGQAHGPSVGFYVFIFVALLVLLFLSVWIAQQPVPENSPARDWLTALGYTIAGLKAAMIILWFMHVKMSSKLTWVFASAAFFWLAIMFSLTTLDYLSRGTSRGQDSGPPSRNIAPDAQEHGTADRAKP